MRLIADHWLDARKWQATAAARELHPDVGSLIVSTKSLTYELEALYGESLMVELNKVGYLTIEGELAQYMGVAAGTKGLDRQVWLTIKGRRLVYARSIFSVEHTEQRLIALLKQERRPIGRVFVEEKIAVSKEALEIATEIKDNRQFGFSPQDGHPVARRYRLSRRDEAGRWYVKGVVFEVLSPELTRLTIDR